MSVANALHHAGVASVVLEARGRVGGRLHTVDLAGSPVDLGGFWMHHPSGNPLRRFAREAGVECHPGDPLPTLSAFDVGTRLWLSREDVEASLTGDLGGFLPALAALRERLGPQASGRTSRRTRPAPPSSSRWRGYGPRTSTTTPTSATCLEGATCPSWTPWPVGSTSASTGRWSAST